MARKGRRSRTGSRAPTSMPPACQNPLICRRRGGESPRQRQRHSSVVSGMITLFQKLSPARRQLRSAGGGNAAAGCKSSADVLSEKGSEKSTVAASSSISNSDTRLVSFPVDGLSLSRRSVADETELQSGTCVVTSTYSEPPEQGNKENNGEAISNVSTPLDESEAKAPELGMATAVDSTYAESCVRASGMACRPVLRTLLETTRATSDGDNLPTLFFQRRDTVQRSSRGHESTSAGASPSVTSSADSRRDRRASVCASTRFERISQKLSKRRRTSLVLPLRERQDEIAKGNIAFGGKYRAPSCRRVISRSQSDSSVSTSEAEVLALRAAARLRGSPKPLSSSVETQHHRLTGFLKRGNSAPYGVTDFAAESPLRNSSYLQSTSDSGQKLEIEEKDNALSFLSSLDRSEISSLQQSVGESDDFLPSTGNMSLQPHSSDKFPSAGKPAQRDSVLSDGYHHIEPKQSVRVQNSVRHRQDSQLIPRTRSSFGGASAEAMGDCDHRLSQPQLHVFSSPVPGASSASNEDEKASRLASVDLQDTASAVQAQQGESVSSAEGMSDFVTSASKHEDDPRFPALGRFINRKGRVFFEITQNGSVSETEWQGSVPASTISGEQVAAQANGRRLFEQAVARGRFEHRDGLVVLRIDSGVFGEPETEVVWTGSKPEVLSLQECRLDKHLPLLCSKPWYFHGFHREDAEACLNGKPEGTFLVRPCQSRKDVEFALTVRHGDICVNFLIPYRYGIGYVVHSQTFTPAIPLARHSLGSFVAVLSEASQNGTIPWFADRAGRPIVLRVPAQHVPSLQDICRAAIRSRVRRTKINELPLPRPMKNFLKMNICC